MTNNRKIKNLARTIAADQGILYTEALLIAREQVGALAAHPLIGRNIVLTGGPDHLFRAHRALASIAKKAGRTVFVIPDWVNRGEYSTFAPEENVLNPAKGLVEALGKIMAGQRLDDAPEVTIFVSGTVNLSDSEWHMLRNIAVTQSHHRVRLSVYAPNWTPVLWPRVDALGQAADLIEVRDDIAQVSIRGAETVELDLAEADPYSSYDFMMSNEGAIPIGVGADDRVQYFAPGSGHILVAGVTGAGKSSLAMSAAYSAIVRGWEVHVAEPKGAHEYLPLSGFLKSVSVNAYDVAKMLETVAAEQERRYRLMADHNVSGFDLLPDDVRPARIMVIIDGCPELTGTRAEQNYAASRARLLKIASTARSTGITLLITSQVSTEEHLKAQFSTRILLGGYTPSTCQQLFGMVIEPIEGFPQGSALWATGEDLSALRVWYASPERFARALAVRLGKPKPVLEESPSAVRPASTPGETGLPIGVNPAGEIISIGSSLSLTKGDPLTPKVIDNLKASVAERGGTVMDMPVSRVDLISSVREAAEIVVSRHDRMVTDYPPVIVLFSDVEASLSDKVVDELRSEPERLGIRHEMDDLRRKVAALVESGPQVGVYVVRVTSVIDAINPNRHTVVATPSGTGLLHAKGELVRVWDV